MTFFFEAAINWVNDLWQSPAKCVSIGNNGDYVILMHALAKSSREMKALERALSEEGYVVLNLNYPSRKHDIEDLTENFLAKAVKKLCIDKKKKINFIGSSLGTQLIRQYLQDNPKLNIGRVVMIAPPNRGSEVVDFMQNNILCKDFFRWFFGPAAAQLGARKSSYVNTQLEKEVKYDLGVIAGDCCINPLAPFIISGTSDGRVSLSATRIKGMRDHVVIHSPHCFIASNDETIKQVSYFLSYGQFYHGK